MKESVLDVLMYLFEHYFDDETELDSDRESLKQELIEAGFPESEIGKAFKWLEGLTAGEAVSEAREGDHVPATRIYTDEECERLDLECRSFLLFLEQVRVLDSITRELVIERVEALEGEEIDLEQLKWVVLMVLFNRPGKEAVFAWMEDFVLDEASRRLH
jgi:Smg protein